MLLAYSPGASVLPCRSTASARYCADRASAGPQAPLSYVGRAPVARRRRAGRPPSPRLRRTSNEKGDGPRGGASFSDGSEAAPNGRLSVVVGKPGLLWGISLSYGGAGLQPGPCRARTCAARNSKTDAPGLRRQHSDSRDPRGRTSSRAVYLLTDKVYPPCCRNTSVTCAETTTIGARLRCPSLMP